MNNLPEIDNYYNIENEKIDFFWQNGFVVLKNVLSKSEISAYRHEIKKVAEERNKDKGEIYIIHKSPKNIFLSESSTVYLGLHEILSLL